MRLHEIQHQLSTIRRQLRAGKRQIDQEALRQYATDGTLPDDPLTAAYVELTESARRCMVASIGADADVHEQACADYEAALSGWREVLRGGAI